MEFTKSQIHNLEIHLGVRENIGEYEKKYIKKVQYFCDIFQYIPGVLMVGIGNSIAMNAGKETSDIDLFVVTKKNTLWFVRIIMTLMVGILGQRKTQKNHAGKICLSFFCTQEALDFSNFALEEDIYLYYWILTMKPILMRGDIYEKLLLKNSWVEEMDIEERVTNNTVFLTHKLPGGRDKVNIVIEKIDAVLKKMFLPRTKKHYESLGKPFGVIISDDMLKFHDGDKRKEISKKVLEKKEDLPSISNI